MAVVQISRIQVRRGQKNIGSGIPQLASGEIGWAVDTREMYIGNGSVAEGSPSVGNTKILTEFDNLFSVANTYIYKGESGVVATGGVGGTDIQRTLQDRLDDRVSGKSFGLTGQSTQNATVKLQTAIDQLGLKPKDILMIGDDINVDIGGAQQINLQTCLVKTGKYGKQPNPKSIKPNYLVPKLSNIKSLLF